MQITRLNQFIGGSPKVKPYRGTSSEDGTENEVDYDYNLELDELGRMKDAAKRYLDISGRNFQRILRETNEESGIPASFMDENEITEMADAFVEDFFYVFYLVPLQMFEDKLLKKVLRYEGEAGDEAAMLSRSSAINYSRRRSLISSRLRTLGNGRRSRPFGSATTQVAETALPKVYEDNYNLAINVARSRGRRSGLTETELEEVLNVAIDTLKRVSGSYEEDHGSGASFKTYLLSNLVPNIDRRIRKIKSNRQSELSEADTPSGRTPIEEALADEETGEMLDSLVEELPQRQQTIVREHYGLGGRERKSLQEIAEELSVHPVTARKDHTDALRRMKLLLQEKGVSLRAFTGKRRILSSRRFKSQRPRAIW